MAGSRQSKKDSAAAKVENDTKLWQRAMENTTRLSPPHQRSVVTKEEAPRDTKISSPAPRKAAARPIRASRQEPVLQAPAAPGKANKHVVRRIKRGAQGIEARLDLHGMTQMEARQDLRLFIRDTAARGCRCVLVITGKGGRASLEAGFRDSPPGVLRRVVPQWLAAPDLSPLVAGFEPALPQHGGAGALYVQLRRRQNADGN